jgi:hypothetical protein
MHNRTLMYFIFLVSSTISLIWGRVVLRLLYVAVWDVTRTLRYVICYMLYNIWCMLYVVCYMLYVVCYVLNPLSLYHIPYTIYHIPYTIYHKCVLTLSLYHYTTTPLHIYHYTYTTTHIQYGTLPPPHDKAHRSIPRHRHIRYQNQTQCKIARINTRKTWYYFVHSRTRVCEE